jgi:hypothetical protein
VITGNRQTRLFAGNPIPAKFQDIVFQDGSDVFDLSLRAALHLLDGSVEIVQCKFIGNEASVCVASLQVAHPHFDILLPYVLTSFLDSFNIAFYW